MFSEPISDEHLLFIVGQTDARLFAEGMDIRQRSFEVPISVMRQFGYVEVVFAGSGRAPLFERIENAYRHIYRPHDLAMGGHIGVYMFRDVFVRIGVPLVYGQCALNPFDHMDLTPVQCRILEFDGGLQKCVDQFLDVTDIQYGIGALKPQFATNADLVGLLRNAQFHLHGAAAVLTGGYDHRGAVQSSLLSMELALKGLAAAQGLDRENIKRRFGHLQRIPKNDRLASMLDFISNTFPSADRDRIERVMVQRPDFVENRYNAEQPKRRETGELAMGAQYVVSEVVRQLSDRDIRSENPSTPTRAYPI